MPASNSLGLNEYAPLRRVALRHPRAAYGGPAAVAASWQALGYSGAPDFARACADFDHFAAALTEAGAAIDYLPAENGLTLDSLYLRDAAIVAPGGIVLGNMGKAARSQEAATLTSCSSGAASQLPTLRLSALVFRKFRSG